MHARTLLRLGGIAGLVFLLDLVLQNAVFLAGAPVPGVSLADVAAFYGSHRLGVIGAVVLVAINMPLVVLFTHVVAARGEGTPGAFWGSVARTAVGVMSSLFLVTTLLQAALAARAPQLLADSPAALQLVWDMHNAAFALVGVPLGLLTAAVALAAPAAGLAPRWLVPVGVVGGVLLVAGGACAVLLVEGVPTVALNGVGFLGWGVTMAVVSWRMLRAARAASPHPGAASVAG